MTVEPQAAQDRQTQTVTATLKALFGDLWLGDFGVALWDGTRLPARRSQHFVLCVNEPGALRAAFTPPLDLNAGRAFASGALDVEGDVERAVDTFYRAAVAMTPARAAQLLRVLGRLPKSRQPVLREAVLRGRLHSRERDRAAIGFHYDQPIEFYRSFLDQELVYSCGYYNEGVDTLDDAQAAKLDYILKKIRLQTGERLLDIGCGWGALVIRAARRFGAHVLGITLSGKQFEETQRRIDAEGVGEHARVELRDYRDLAGERFDKVVSIGMFEHVGRAFLPQYFRAAFEALRPGGLFLNHGIANQNEPRKNLGLGGFMERFVFPDGELVPISDSLDMAEHVGFEIRDVESLREHYALTLRAWVANLEQHRDAAIAAAGAQSYRIWRLFMAGSAQGFTSGRLSVFQCLLARPSKDGRVGLPLTRRDLYHR
jgi:cyclopropane-fatty-acyl-phospholipid synthase